MSFTETSTKPSVSTSILLSPSRRRRISPPPGQQPTCTRQDLWKWTLTQEAVAPCRVRDVFAMKANEDRDADFFWLGQVPCRTVKLVGLLVGVQVYEKRVVYSVDDGTAVIDCIYRPEVPVSPTKAGPKGKPKPQSRLHPSSTSPTLTSPIDPAPTLKPIAFVGTSVKVVGKVNRWHNTRQIRADSIQRCQSQNEEILHWRQVLHLHKSHYSLPGPFVVPVPTPAPPSSSKPQPEVELNVEPKSMLKEPSSPMTASSVPSSAATSPTKSEKHSILGLKPPPKLRHPSRLPSRELTGNTFRIYLKHYMDNAPAISNTIDEEMDDALSKVLSTPTKHKRRSIEGRDDRTPRPIRHAGPSMIEQTHRPQSRLPSKEDARGFTLSYLRRVPELADMAQRVVKAEAKRKRREEREREKRRRSQVSSSISGTPFNPTRPTKPAEEKVAAKVKRLFQWAIIELYKEGGIVLWEGSIRPLPYHSRGGDPETSMLWKHSNSTTIGESSIFSSTVNTSAISCLDEEDEGELSDPREDEESYVPTTPPFLASPILTCIRILTSPPPPSANLTRIQSLTIAPPPGPTPAQITTYLRKTDERYERVGEWLIKDALEWLADEEGGERVWCVGGGRWEICM